MKSVEKLSADEVKNLEERVSVPYRVEDVTVLSPGEWNGLQWTASELREAVKNTDFDQSQSRGDESPPNGSIFYDHKDRSAESFVGQVENVRVNGKGDVKTDLVVSDKQTAMNLEFGAPFGVSPKADGLVDERGKMQDFEFENFSLVVNPAVKTTWLNESIETVLQDMSVHQPRFKTTTDSDWESPNLSDFTDKAWNDLSDRKKRAIGRHFLISKTGSPAENYTHLALPVVSPDGSLNLNALQNAKSRVSQVSGIDEKEINRVSKMINNLANGYFEADFEEVEMGLQEAVTHEPEFSGTTTGEWDAPALEDFTGKSWEDMTQDEKSNVGDHFIVSRSGFPSENFGDLALPVVEPSGELNLNALQNAKARAGQVDGITDDQVESVEGMIDGLANDNFEDADFGDEEEMSEENDIMVKNPMAEEEQETQEPETEEASVQEEESVENSEDFVTAEELEDFKSEVVDELKQELADGDEDEADEEVEGGDAEEVEEEASDTELSEFEEFRHENPDLSLSEAAERFEEESKSADEKIEEMSQKFEDKISDLEEKLESKEEEVEELSEKVGEPQRATQASDDGEEEDLRDKVSELGDEELHAQIFQQMNADRGVKATKEMMNHD